MATLYQHGQQDHGHDHGGGHGHGEGHGHDESARVAHEVDWFDEDVVKGWIADQQARRDERRRQFVTVRAFIPKGPEQELRYLNLGAGSGALDALLLDHFRGANAIVLDGSMTMLTAARKELARFGERVEYVQADLSGPDWLGAVAGPFDFVISTLAIHYLGDPRRIRELYREVRGLTGHGGTFLNLDYVRPVRAELGPLGEWISRDPEAGFAPGESSVDMPGTLAEHLGWLGEAGFGCAEVYWKAMDLALIAGIRDHLHMPWGHGSDPALGGAHRHGH